MAPVVEANLAKRALTETGPREAVHSVDKGSEWILSVARHRDQMADPIGTLRNAEKC
eukprot:COSAG05_NODE_2_length_63105_cov_159.292956_26_plen_57_part_00